MIGYGEKLEIFIDSTHPAKVTDPESLEVRHLAFEVDDVNAEWERLKRFNPESIKVKDNGKKVSFIKDPARSIKGTTKSAKRSPSMLYRSNRGNRRFTCYQ